MMGGYELVSFCMEQLLGDYPHVTLTYRTSPHEPELLFGMPLLQHLVGLSLRPTIISWSFESPRTIAEIVNCVRPLLMKRTSTNASLETFLASGQKIQSLEISGTGRS